MKHWTLIAILIIVVVLGGGIYFFLPKNLGSVPTPNSVNNTYQNAPNENGMVSTKAEATVILEPKTALPATVGQQVEYVLSVESDDTNIIGVQNVLHFDAQAISNITIEPASLLPQPEILLENIDTTEGTISYALGTFTPVPANGDVYTITFILNEPRTNVLSFDQSKMKLALSDQQNKQAFDEGEVEIRFIAKPLNVAP